jgi:chromosome segregation ATPase
VDPTVLTALIGGAGTVLGAAVASPVAVALISRRLRDAQAEHLGAQTAQIRQDIYQQLTADLRAELDRVRGELRTARESLASTSAEAERLRQRVLGLESRVAQLEHDEQHLVAELATTRAQLANREATITVQREQIAHLQGQLAALQARPA